MLVLFTIFLSSFIIAFSGALMPGPLLSATIAESATRGYIAGPILIIGHAILEFFLLIALLLGLSPFFNQEYVYIFIAIAGGAVLLWMAAGMFRELPNLKLSFEKEDRKQKNLIFSGALLSVANPYWTVWWATIGLGYIIHSMEYGLLGVLIFFIGHILADLVWYTTVSVTVGKGRNFMTDRVYRWIIGVCAVFLLFFSCYFFYSGINTAITEFV